MFFLLIALALFSTPAQASPSTPDGCNLSEMGAMTFFHCLVTHNDTVEAQGADVADLLERVQALEELATTQAGTIETQAGTIATLQETVDLLSSPDLSGYVTDDDLAAFNYATQEEVAVCLVEEDLATVPVTSFPGTLATTAELDSVWAALDNLPDSTTTIVTEDGDIDLGCIETRLANLEAVNEEELAVCLYGDSDDDGQVDALDCAPEDPTLQTYLFHPDHDDDTFGAHFQESACSTSADTIPDGYVDNNNDCNDSSELVFPGQSDWFVSGYVSPSGISWDYNCDESESLRWGWDFIRELPDISLVDVFGDMDAFCFEPGVDQEGWHCSEDELTEDQDGEWDCLPPACGEEGSWLIDAVFESEGMTGFATYWCERVVESRVQQCQ